MIWNRVCIRKDKIIKIRKTYIIDIVSFIKFLIYIVLKYYLAYLIFYRILKISYVKGTFWITINGILMYILMDGEKRWFVIDYKNWTSKKEYM